MMHWGAWSSGGWSMSSGWLIMVFFWILVVLSIASVVQTLVNGRKGPVQSEDPAEVLKIRYSRGEITREQFEHKQRDLKRA